EAGPAGRKRELRAGPGGEEELARPPTTVREREAERAVDGQGDERVVDVVQSREVELDVDALVDELDLEPRRALAGLEPDETNVAVAADAQHVDALEGEVRLELGNGGGDNGSASLRQGLQQLRLRTRH